MTAFAPLASSLLIAALACSNALCQSAWQTDPGLSSRYGFGCAFDAARGETVLFGGFDGVTTDQTWVWDGDEWQLREPPQRPSPRSNVTMTWDGSQQRVVLFGGTTNSQSFTDTWAWDGSTWTMIAPSTSVVGSSSLRFLMHDAGRDRLVLLSMQSNSVGLAEFDGNTWTNVTPFAPWPPFDFFAAATFDQVSGQVAYVPLGSSNGTLWRWNGTTWTSQQALLGQQQPGARLVSDAVGQRLLLAGGANSASTTTLYGLSAAATSWQPLASGGPVASTGDACFDTARNRLVFVGGQSRGTPADSSVFEWSAGPWLRMTGAPPYARRSYTSAYERANDRLWLFGGQSSFGAEGDLWSLDQNGWQVQWRASFSLPPAVNPGTVQGRRLVYDEARQDLLLMAGDTSSFSFWRWTGSDFAAIGGTVPPPRSDPGVVYDRARGRVVLFGGRSGSQSLADTWVWDGLAWTELTPAEVPPARTAPGMAYDPIRDRVVMCGGTQFLEIAGETWELDGDEWQLRAASGPFPGAQSGAMAYDEARQVVVAAVPGASGGTLRTWQWLGDGWAETFPANAPPTRLLPGLCATSSGVLSFGGNLNVSGSPYLSDRRWLRTQTPAAVAEFGAPGTSSAGPLVLRAAGNGPWLGSRFEAGLTGLPSIVLPGLWAGTSRTTWAGMTLPVDLGVLGWPGVLVRIAPEIPVGVLDLGDGTAKAGFDLPLQPSLVAMELHLQALLFEPLSGALTTSNGLTLLLGLR